MMKPAIIGRILAIEEKAATIHREAEQQAAKLIEEAKAVSSTQREKKLTEAHYKAQRIVTEGQENAEAVRARILAQAGAEAQQLETLAAKNYDRAVAFVLTLVAERE